MREGKNKKQHAEGVWKSDQLNREKGSRGNCPLRSPEAAPLVGFGATPQLFRVKPTQRKKSTKAQAAKRPCPKLRASSDAPPSCSFDQLCCVAPNGRDQTAWLPVIAGLFRKQGISRLRARVGGFAVAPDTPSQCTPMFLGLYCCRGFRLCGGESGALRSPPTPLRSAHSCGLIFIVSWVKWRCPPSAPQSAPHAAVPDSQTAPPAPGTAARRPSAPQTG